MHYPKIGKNVFVDGSAQVIGRVKLGDYSSVWPGCVLRADINRIVVGRYTNIQDLSLLHVETDRACIIGDYVVIGHHVILHGCTVKNQSLIGMGSVLLDGSVVGEGTILGAGSLVTQGQKLKPGALYFGSPAKFVRKLTRKEIAGLKKWALRYVCYADDHRKGQFGRLSAIP
ncbi:MAG: gamma carbonic anhydrase family protein [Candidatus Omnitrophota bacterium]|nr:gamma carbonic anhydrase family protein [Candidatus Omnitrophota bacterium]